jgi:hypothetical protein
LERGQQIKNLEIEKEELKKEIRKMKENSDMNVDLDAPIQKVITVLQSIGIN